MTTYVLSADTIRKRSAREVGFLFDLRAALTGAVRGTAGRARHLTMAIAHDGRSDIVGAIRAAMRDGADASDPEAITAHLGGGPRKEIDLVIRTSGEHGLSGFFPWQTAHAEVYVCPKPWPAFGRDDFTEALRHYSDRADPDRHAAP